MNDREKIAWLYRRVGFGLAPGQLDQLEATGPARVLEALIDPDAHGVPVAPDPWAGLDFSDFDPKQNRRYLPVLVGSWLKAMASTPRPLHEWIRWFWHGHFVSTFGVVKHPQLMVNQLAMLGREGLGDFKTLLRSVSTDAAMLVYLDGVDNRKGAVNENYGRELLELFGLGIGNYTEDDVRAGAEALTGWVIDRGTGSARLAPRRHDDTPRSYLGRTGVHDVDTVVDAVVGHQACARFITGKLGRAILGPSADIGLLDRLAGEFRAGGLSILSLVRSLLDAGLDGASTPMVMAPVPWLAGAIRSTGVDADSALRTVGAGLVPAGQLPLEAPNVAGWPGGRNWLTSSATVARFNMASGISSITATGSAAMSAASTGDSRKLADVLGHPEGFGPATQDALAQVARSGGTSVLSIALASPELVLA